jgi:hypothetical protein
MAMQYCFECDRLLDGDWIEFYDWENDEVCIECHMDLTPEDYEDYEVGYDSGAPKAFAWSVTHKDYDGAPIHSFGGPADQRHFIGPSLKDVWEQVIEYNEENENANS